MKHSLARDLAAYKAFGMLRSMLRAKQIPECLEFMAAGIVSQYETADAGMKAAEAADGEDDE